MVLLHENCICHLCQDLSLVFKDKDFNRPKTLNVWYSTSNYLIDLPFTGGVQQAIMIL